ncbi:ABC transporter permease [Paracoccus litorisediminis]|uniref:ABC transporter permease subunit n=1 Tax=Paracoccus litorisediminis TaxID=2006130 RepID=A0A844HMN0_9RHOB|nr:ABC transporter permease [Paracoccus litorisediminis]MTH60339.1 ABC transporter permease subunit [Paracoccus litorisediminis]
MTDMSNEGGKIAATPSPSQSLRKLAKYAIPVIAILGGVLIWHIASTFTSPLFLPSPAMVWGAAVEMALDGSLAGSIGASAWRIFAGWAAGVILGVPLGLFMGRFAIVRLLADPYIEFFRFIPPIAFVTLAVIWLGPGEITKIALIFYTTIFIVTLNTIAGVESVNPLRLQAARSLGATRMQEMTTIILPSTVPYMVTGARIAMGNSFLTVVSAEIVSAQQGLGSLIWTARNFARTDWVFVGIIALGCLGFVFDRIFRMVTNRTLRRFL